MGRASGRRRSLWMALGFALACLPLPVSGQELPASAWIDRMLRAIRTDSTLAARIEASVFNGRGGRREFALELLRDAQGPTVRTVLEMRESPDTPPVVLRIDSLPDGSVVSWSWDVRFQAFVRMAGLDGTEAFAGTHFHMEDLGLTGLVARREGAVGRTTVEDRELIEITSGAYHHYGRVLTRLDPDSGLPVSTWIYDATDARIWELSFDSAQRVGEVLLPTQMRAFNPVSREATTLAWRDLVVGARLSEDAFDLEALEVRIRRGDDPVAYPEPQD